MKKLLDAAKEARHRSYSPYSRHQVGAAVRTADGRVFTGCNIENSSFGATVCAERVAIQTAVAAGATAIEEILVVTDAEPPWPPCGLCRQVIAEFGRPDTKIHLANLKGKIETETLASLVPRAFTPGHLKTP